MRIRRGDIHDAYVTESVATFDGVAWRMTGGINNATYGFAHITGVPDTITLQKVQAAITAQVDDPLLSINQAVALRLRKWSIPAAIVPATVRTKIKTEREITVDFATAKSYIRKKVVTDRLVAALDDITTQLADADLA